MEEQSKQKHVRLLRLTSSLLLAEVVETSRASVSPLCASTTRGEQQQQLRGRQREGQWKKERRSAAHEHWPTERVQRKAPCLGLSNST
jgi:hypothetical protein